jgi:2-aminoethylphosphonate-pyruvate transaminase
MLAMIKVKEKTLALTAVTAMDWSEFEQASGAAARSEAAEVSESSKNFEHYDWIVCAYTETADAFALDLRAVKAFASRVAAKLMVDATGSINLEDGHELADVTMFSSCKGLGGLTGAGFITFNRSLLAARNGAPKEFILDLDTYLEKKTTSPAHTLLSLDRVSGRFAEHREMMRQSKREFVKIFGDVLFRQGNQPYLCTKVKDAGIEWLEGVVPYEPRVVEANCQVVCHLFEQFPSNRAPGEVYAALRGKIKE